MEVEVSSNYTVSNHAMERYAERIANKDNATDARQYINQHGDDIRKWINKLIHYGELIYEGKIREYNCAKIYYKDFWVIVVDPNKNHVVTLYKINLGDDEVNELFVSKIKSQIDSASIELQEIAATCNGNIDKYREVIKNNNDTINEYKSIIKKLEEANSGYNSLIKSETAAIEIKQSELNDLVDRLTARKVF